MSRIEKQPLLTRSGALHGHTSRDQSQRAERPHLHASVPPAGAQAVGRSGDRGLQLPLCGWETSDKYVRVTAFLASVLFLIGISTQFPVGGVQYALVGFGAALLVLSLVQQTQIASPP